MVASYPISTLLPGVNLNATLLSHGDSLDFGLLGDKHALPDLDYVVERMAMHLEDLSGEVLGKKNPATRRKSTTGKKSSSRKKSPPGRKNAAPAKPGTKAKARRKQA
jgi:hypothetical protein